MMPTLYGEVVQRRGADRSAPAAFVVGEREHSFSELADRVRECSAWLVADGCGRGEIVGITIADDTAHLVVSLALLVLGLPQVTLPTYDPPIARRRLAERLAVSRVVVVDPSLGLPALATSRFDSDRRTGAPQPLPIVADPHADAIYYTSSGTTGEPKIMAYSQALMATRNDMRNFVDRERLYMPMTVESYPGKATRLCTVWRGVTSVLADNPAPTASEIAAACARHAVTRIDLGVLHLANLLAGGVEAVPAGTKVFASGSRVPMRMRETFRSRTRARLYVEYGAREIGAGTSTYPVDRDEAQETVGPTSPIARVEIVDPDGRQLPPGEVGEIRMRSAGMVTGYHADLVATARHFRDGWFHPGDLGSFSPNGSLCIAGRTDDVMNLNGIKIYPSEIERVLEDEPGVRAAAAFAVASVVHGQIPVAAIEWCGKDAPDLAAIAARARMRLGVRAPRKVLVVDELPRNAGGKVAKAELVRLAEAMGATPVPEAK
jgi:acyl-CoA synthetase (AMP-forming)/AMP-acid ligase II